MFLLVKIDKYGGTYFTEICQRVVFVEKYMRIRVHNRLKVYKTIAVYLFCYD